MLMISHYTMKRGILSIVNEHFQRSDETIFETFILQFNGELAMYFSVHVDRKVPKERPLRESPTVPPLRNPPPDSRDSFAKAKESDCAYGRKDQVTRTNGGAPSARNSPFASALSCSLYCRIKENRGLPPNGRLPARSSL